MQFAPKHIVAIVVAVSAAAVLTPVGVMAATGQLVNITDPVDAGNKARVTDNGALQVETRPRATRYVKNVSHVDIASLTPRPLLEVAAPSKIALLEVTVGVRDFGNPVIAPTIVDLVSYVRTSGVNPCGQAGWTGTTLRRITLMTDKTEQVTFDNAGLPLPVAPAGKRQCLAAKLYQWVGDTRVDIGATVYAFS